MTVSLMFDVRRRDADAVIRRLRRLTWSLCEPYFIAGGDADDVMQAARWGLAKAVRDWDPGKAPQDVTQAFLGFARLCITREVVTAVKTSTRAKHAVLSHATHLDRPVHGADDSEVSLHEVLSREADDPAHVVITLEEARAALRALDTLSPLEHAAIRRVALMGESYARRGEAEKQVDNAIQRARRKLAAVPDAWVNPEALRPQVREFEFEYRVHYLCRTAYRTREAAESAAMELRWGRVMECVPRRLLDGADLAPVGRSRADGRRGAPVWRIRVRLLASARLRTAA